MTGLNQWAAAHVGLLIAALAFVAVVALVMALWLAFRLHRLQHHYSLLTRGTDGGNLRAVLEMHVNTVRATEAQVLELDNLVRGIDRSSQSHLQRIGFLRFNPFRDAGGDQSFALALADRHGNGVVLSSLYGRDGARIYGKPLAAWASPYPLTEEEQQAIARAQAAA